jgi:hypothetical protein
MKRRLPLLARLRHADWLSGCPFPGLDRKCAAAVETTRMTPERTSAMVAYVHPAACQSGAPGRASDCVAAA